METVEAIYENGTVKFLDKNLPKKRFKIHVTFVEELKLEPQEKMSGEEFVKKWAGFLKGADIKDYKEERIKYLQEKYK